MKRKVDVRIIRSTTNPTRLSLRLWSSADSETATPLLKALEAAGFKPGDRAVLTLDTVPLSDEVAD